MTQGWSQRPGIDYGSTLAPACRIDSIRMVLVIANAFNWDFGEADVVPAFLHAKVKEDIYVMQPPGFEHVDQTTGVELKQSLYALAQSPRNWFRAVSMALAEIGFLY